MRVQYLSYSRLRRCEVWLSGITSKQLRHISAGLVEERAGGPMFAGNLNLVEVVETVCGVLRL